MCIYAALVKNNLSSAYDVVSLNKFKSRNMQPANIYFKKRAHSFGTLQRWDRACLQCVPRLSFINLSLLKLMSLDWSNSVEDCIVRNSVAGHASHMLVWKFSKFRSQVNIYKVAICNLLLTKVFLLLCYEKKQNGELRDKTNWTVWPSGWKAWLRPSCQQPGEKLSGSFNSA